MATKRSILLVDDDRSILRVFTRLLERQGYQVTAVETGGEAEVKIKENTFDAALIDYRLADVEGTCLLPLLSKKSPCTLKIMLTGSPGVGIEILENNVADVFLLKPVKPETLLGVLQEKLF